MMLDSAFAGQDRKNTHPVARLKSAEILRAYIQVPIHFQLLTRHLNTLEKFGGFAGKLGGMLKGRKE